MADLEVQPFGLTRAQSAAVIRGSAIDNQPQLMLTRTYSIPNVFDYHRRTDQYKFFSLKNPFKILLIFRPQFSIYSYSLAKHRPYFPYRYVRDTERGAAANSFWYNRYYQFTPLFKRSIFRPYFYYRHDFDNPSYSRRAYDPFFTPHFDAYSYGNWGKVRQHYV
ncbi:unnamed protein product [Meloidogyne enterolobii]|uniref:Uncharacterized protein n=1 Tax=Meloidogyne enterolobii TaxID=390850 RepID=A0ACB1A4F9_MELEN